MPEAETIDQSIYEKLAGRISVAEKFREKQAKTKKWKTYINYYKGDFYDDLDDDTRISVNLVHGNCKSDVASLAARTPRYFAKAKKKEFESREKLVENALNGEVKNIGVKKTLKRLVRDTHLLGYGVSKMGYLFETEPSGNEADNTNSQVPIFNEYIKKDSAYYTRVSPFRFFMDPDAEEQVSDSKTLIEAIFVPREYAKAKYNIQMDSGNFIAEWVKDLFSGLGIAEKKQVERVLLYEIWDNETHIYYLVSLDEKRIVKTFKFKKHPYRLLTFNDVPDEVYPISTVKLYESQQKEKNLIRTMMSRHVKRFNRKYSAAEGSLSLKELQKLEANKDGSVIMTKTQGQTIFPIPDAPLQSDAYRYEEKIDGDVGTITASTDVSRGGTPSIRRSATEIATGDSYLQNRIADKQDVLDDYLNEIGSDLLEIMIEKYDATRFMKMVGEDGKPMWAEWNNQSLKGEFDVFTKTGATAAVDKPLKLRQVMEGFKLSLGNPYIDQKELTEIFVKAVFEDYDNEKLIIRNALEVSKDPIRAEIFRRQLAQKMTEQTPLPNGALPPEQTGAPVAGNLPGVAATKRASEENQPQGPQ